MAVGSRRRWVDPELYAVVREYVLPEPDLPALAAIRNAPPRPVELSDRVERTEMVVDGEAPVPVRIHRPVGLAGTAPAVVVIHGGGLVFGTYRMDDALLDQWCQRFGVVGISVEYRLAPDTPYPGPLDDCERALTWVGEHAGELGVDPQAIGLYGISAGGCLAAGLALRSRERSGVRLRFVVLETPMLDDRSTASMADELLVWTRQWNDFGWRSYLGRRAGGAGVPGDAAPGRAEDLGGLPPTLVAVGSADGFLDEDVAFALRMNACGSPCDLRVYPGLTHGYRLGVDSAVVRRAVTEMDDWVEQQLACIRAR